MNIFWPHFFAVGGCFFCITEIFTLVIHFVYYRYEMYHSRLLWRDTMPEAKGKMEDDKLQFVDTLRALAIIGVLLVHVSQHVDGLNGWLQKGLSIGAKGVALFYMASAFTLFLSLSRRSGDKRERISAYLLRRFFGLLLCIT